MAIRECNDRWIEVTQDTQVRAVSASNMTLQLRKFSDPHISREYVIVSDPWKGETEADRHLLLFPLNPLIEALERLKGLSDGE